MNQHFWNVVLIAIDKERYYSSTLKAKNRFLRKFTKPQYDSDLSFQYWTKNKFEVVINELNQKSVTM